MKHTIIKITAAVVSFAIGITVVLAYGFLFHQKPKLGVVMCQASLVPTLSNPELVDYAAIKCADAERRLDGFSDNYGPYHTVKEFYPGFLDKKALCKPDPVIPQKAIEKGAFGIIRVRVLVDCNGRVKRARAISGDPLVRPAFEDAARKARFFPQLLGGELVNVRGVITYNFFPRF